MNYVVWPSLNARQMTRFIISLIGLIAIIGITYWFNSKNWNVWKKK
jgi:hypothetical protein